MRQLQSAPSLATAEANLEIKQAFWSETVSNLLRSLSTDPQGLSNTEAERRLSIFGANALSPPTHFTSLRLFFRNFKTPLMLLLITAAIVAALVQDWTDAVIILLIILGSGVLTFVQERRATKALDQLRSQVCLKSNVLRNGSLESIASEEIVPGDVVVLSAGSLVPADSVVIEAKDFFVSQAALTGEALPVERKPCISDAQTPLARRENAIFMGSSVRSGTAKALVVHTGSSTVMGSIAAKLQLQSPQTEFERGIKKYGQLLAEAMLFLVVIVVAASLIMERPFVESLLFALALAVGGSPELLPAIVSVTLARGARQMAEAGVIVRRLNAIENLGSMDILCADKTGTLTEGVMALDAALDLQGQQSKWVLQEAFCNAHFQTGLANPLDAAICLRGAKELAGALQQFTLVDEIPYDFQRKRLSVVIGDTASGSRKLIAKGALTNILDVCGGVVAEGKNQTLTASMRVTIEDLFHHYSQQGFRVLGVAEKHVAPQTAYSKTDEVNLTFIGFLLFFDPPKAGVRHALSELRRLGIELKIITGDNQLVSKHVAEQVNISNPRILTGQELDLIPDSYLPMLAKSTDLFVDVDPLQKEQIVLALKKAGHAVGYLGDGINDAPALHAADVGISVEQAVDVAKEAADFVLLKHDLTILIRGVEQGRVTFANTLKYISITTSANFGNTLSMAMASLFLPFLPLLAKQILLNNFLSDFPAMSVAADRVDPEMTEKPHRWNMMMVRRFMIVYGLISSAFDLLTFAVLIVLFQASIELFRTAWFVESLLTELAIMLILRTHRPFYQSRPGALLLTLTLTIATLALLIPYLPGAHFFGFIPLPNTVLGALLLITTFYMAISEISKFYAFRRIEKKN